MKTLTNKDITEPGQYCWREIGVRYYLWQTITLTEYQNRIGFIESLATRDERFLPISMFAEREWVKLP